MYLVYTVDIYLSEVKGRHTVPSVISRLYLAGNETWNIMPPLYRKEIWLTIFQFELQSTISSPTRILPGLIRTSMTPTIGSCLYCSIYCWSLPLARRKVFKVFNGSPSSDRSPVSGSIVVKMLRVVNYSECITRNCILPSSTWRSNRKNCIADMKLANPIVFCPWHVVQRLDSYVGSEIYSCVIFIRNLLIDIRQ